MGKLNLTLSREGGSETRITLMSTDKKMENKTTKTKTRTHKKRKKRKENRSKSEEKKVLKIYNGSKKYSSKPNMSRLTNEKSQLQVDV